MQRDEAGDGTATFVVFLSALLKKADELITMGVHANTIIHGYYIATEKALETLDKQAATLNCDVVDIVDCGRNLLTPCIRSMIKAAYPLAFTEGRFERENIRYLKKKGGDIQDSSLINGVVVRKEKAHPNMPDRVTNLRIVINSQRLGIDRLSVKMRGEGPSPIKLNITSTDQLSKFREAEDKLKIQFMKKLEDLKVNVLLCEQPIEEEQKTLLISRGIFALERVDKKDSQAVAKATGARIVGNIKELTAEDIGFAEELFIGKVNLENIVTFKGCSGATFLLRGNLPQTIDELEVAIQNSLTVLKLLEGDSRVLPGGCAAEVEIAQDLNRYALEFPSREQIAIKSFASALMDIPQCLAENYGLNPTDIMDELRRHHAEGFCNFGVYEQGCKDNVCFEPIKVKRSIIRRAFEVSSLMLHVDELLISKDIAKFHKK
jgi:chaperonin GroEL (HSP60 family)